MPRNLLIGFGTETGNSELLAMDAQRIASERGIESDCACMDEIDVNRIKFQDHVLIICSTWGDGEQPDNAQDLYDSMQEIGETDLNGSQFAVLALGDTAFDLFCEAGIQWDHLLEQKGSNRLHERLDCDTDYEDDAEEWLNVVLDKIALMASE